MEAAEAARPAAAADATDAGAVRAAVAGVGAAAVAEAVEVAAQASVCRLEVSAFVAEEKCGGSRPFPVLSCLEWPRCRRCRS
jgi:hypothetical protein